MEELESLVKRAQTGDLPAYEEIVVRFQDMAFGYAYSLLGDFHRAEDVAQQAFMQAYRDLKQLRRAGAFPGWLRKIVFTHCNRLLRGRDTRKLSLEAAGDVAVHAPGPDELAARSETEREVLDAIRSLPQQQRVTTTLFYIDGYSQREIAAFLEVPVTTVNGQLRTARQRLKNRMEAIVGEELKGRALPDDFARRTVEFESACQPLSYEVKEQAGDPGLRDALHIEVAEVLGSSPVIGAGQKYIVRGRYTLTGSRVAWLCLVTNGKSRGHWAGVEAGSGALGLWTEVIQVAPEGAGSIGILMCDADWRELGVRVDVLPRA